jgi:hypothetical protein
VDLRGSPLQPSARQLSLACQARLSREYEATLRACHRQRETRVAPLTAAISADRATPEAACLEVNLGRKNNGFPD